MRQQVVAVVDDDPGMLQGIDRLLKVYKFQTVIFDSAEAFLESAAGCAATCVVLDIHLGGMSGIELRRRLTAAGSDVPVIFISAIDDAAVHEAAMEAGCVAYLRKPFPGTLLIDAINKAAA
jgi:FixJ family two-component response regulator